MKTQTILNSRIIKVKMYGATNHLPHRIGLIEKTRYQITDRKTIGFGNNDQVKDAAIEYLNSIGINIVSTGWIDNELIIMSDSWDKGSGFITIKGETV